MSIISKIDGTICKNILGLSTHLKKHNTSLIDYLTKYETFEIPKCKFCGEDAKLKSGITFRNTCGSKSCISKSFCRKQSVETKNKIRIKRLDYLSQRTGKTAWERRSAGKLSYIEQWFFDKCIEYNLHSTFDIVNEYTIFPYSIDFAFINEKVAVELDGKCHFVNGQDRIQTDIEKDIFLIENGWKVFRIRYDELSNSKIDELVTFIGNNKSKNFDDKIYRNVDFKTTKSTTSISNNKSVGNTYIKREKNKNKTIKCQNSSCNNLHSNTKYCSQMCYKSDVTNKPQYHSRLVNRPTYDILLQEVNEIGYSATGRKYGVSDNAIRKWLKIKM